MLGWRGAGLVLTATVALVAGCGGSPKRSAAPTTSAATSASASASPSGSDALGSATPSPTSSASTQSSNRCRTSHLKVALGQADGAAGSTSIPIVFTNTGSTTCTMYGFPGVSFVTGDSGQQVGSPAKRTGTTPKTVTLAPGRSAHANLRTVQVGNFDAAQCKPVTVRGFRVYPPDETAAVFLPDQTQACSAPGIGVPDIQPVVSGSP
jgi:hypothetical protein